MTKLKQRLPFWGALLITSMLFALLHLNGGLIPYYFGAGIALGLIAQFHQTAWASFIAHAALNGLVTVIALIALTS